MQKHVHVHWHLHVNPQVHLRINICDFFLNVHLHLHVNKTYTNTKKIHLRSYCHLVGYVKNRVHQYHSNAAKLKIKLTKYMSTYICIYFSNTYQNSNIILTTTTTHSVLSSFFFFVVYSCLFSKSGLESKGRG